MGVKFQSNIVSLKFYAFARKLRNSFRNLEKPEIRKVIPIQQAHISKQQDFLEKSISMVISVKGIIRPHIITTHKNLLVILTIKQKSLKQLKLSHYNNRHNNNFTNIHIYNTPYISE